MGKSIYDCPKPKCNGYASSISCAGIHWRSCWNCDFKSDVGFNKKESNSNWKKKLKELKNETKKL